MPELIKTVSVPAVKGQPIDIEDGVKDAANCTSDIP
jgi:hypothetical protein